RIPSPGCQRGARATIVAPRSSLCPWPTRTRNALQIEATPSHELSKPECRPIAQLTLRCASRSIGFRRVETDKPKGLASNPNRVAVQHLNLARIKVRSSRHPCAEGKSDGGTAEHRRQLRTHA